ncbi:hypothetical protein [Hymenobacter guriensis]|uniref:RHS repeat protein n=1 Tax=Hymenobacter guriensis TaxID=2793065 RepID=A0ABS0L756_9BACT|nr:hypothetical protein [Hymenobacter guriensis]MBG8555963.1 hypothetical protein [Hymenobacter guriensis]
MLSFLQASRWFALVTGLLYSLPQLAQSQHLAIETEHFPGAKRMKTESFNRGPAGFWTVYQFDALGRAVLEKRYQGRRHLATYMYTYNQRNQLLRHVTVFDINNRRTQHSQYTIYRYNADSSRVLREVCYTDTDTLYVTQFLKFDSDNRPTNCSVTNYTNGLKSPSTSAVELSYTNGRVTLRHSRSTSYDQKSTTSHTETYEYNPQGDLVKLHRAPQPQGG